MERHEQLTHDQEQQIGVRIMRLFDLDAVACMLDNVSFRVEKVKGGDEVKVIDLTLRVDPFTIDMATAVNHSVRNLLFTLKNVRPLSLIHAVELNYTVPRQRLTVQHLPDLPGGAIVFTDARIHRIRARVTKDSDDYAFLFVATISDGASQQLEYLHAWLTEVRYVTFHAEQPSLDLGDERNDDQPYAH